MKHSVKWTKRFALAGVLTFVLGAGLSPWAYATPQAIDLAEFNLEITEQAVIHTIIRGEGCYRIALQSEGEDGYLYAFYRQDLDWSGQHGIALSMSNESEDILRVAVQLMDAQWQALALPEGSAVLLQKEGASQYEMDVVSQGGISLPPQFVGQVFVPFSCGDDILQGLQGVGITFISQSETICTLTQVSFWPDEVLALYDALGTLRLQFQDAALTVPWVGQSMTTASVVGDAAPQTVSYALVDAPSGASVSPQGKIEIDAAVDATTLLVQAAVNDQLVLTQALPLVTIWETKPEKMLLKDFVVLPPAQRAPEEYLAPFDWCVQNLALLRLLCAGIGAWLLGTFLLWHKDHKKG